MEHEYVVSAALEPRVTVRHCYRFARAARFWSEWLAGRGGSAQDGWMRWEILAACAMAIGCDLEPDLPLPPGGICMDVSHITPEEADAFRVASERWEPHFEPVEVVNDPSCPNAVWNDIKPNDLKGAAMTLLNRWPTARPTELQRADTQVFLNPDMLHRWNQADLEDIFTHEFGHIFGRVDHWGDGLMYWDPPKGSGLHPSEEDRAHVGKLYK